MPTVGETLTAECLSCGYSFAGLDGDVTCPECGTPRGEGGFTERPSAVVLARILVSASAPVLLVRITLIVFGLGLRPRYPDAADPNNWWWDVSDKVSSLGIVLGGICLVGAIILHLWIDQRRFWLLVGLGLFGLTSITGLGGLTG